MKQNLEPMMSSECMIWETPSALFDQLNREFHFTADLAASAANTKVKDYFFGPGSPFAEDALSVSWRHLCGYLNPPYGRELGDWVRKAYEETRNRFTTVVMLIPSRTDTGFWHNYVTRADDVRFVRGRIVFELDGKPILDKNGKPQSAPFPSAIVVFGRANDKIF